MSDIEYDLIPEQAVLGGMLLSEDVIPDIIEIVQGEDFLRSAHTTIFDTIVDMHHRGDAIDPITVGAQLERMGVLHGPDGVGGGAYLHTLLQSVPMAAHAVAYAEQVSEMGARRRLGALGQFISQQAEHSTRELADLVTDAASALTAITSGDGVGDALLVNREVRREKLRRKAKAILDAEEAPELQWWDIDALMASDSPSPVVPGFLYRDSLSRIFGPPGGGKTFVALDIALHVALGKSWCGREVDEGPVVYVAAEGQAVNRDRVEAWLGHSGYEASDLRGKFITVPHAVLLTPPAMGSFLAKVKDLQPRLVIFDTKNACMVGEENSSTDSALMRRALNAVRADTNACVVLIDHTGHGETARARGSSAVTAMMDTEALVTKDENTIIARVTRDKAAQAGTTVSFTLKWCPPAAVLVPDEEAQPQRRTAPEWKSWPIPDELEDAPGLVPDLARVFSCNAAGGDPAKIGLTRTDALAEMGLKHNHSTGRRAWSSLLADGFIEAAAGVKTPTGRHVWKVKGNVRKLHSGGAS